MTIKTYLLTNYLQLFLALVMMQVSVRRSQTDVVNFVCDWSCQLSPKLGVKFTTFVLVVGSRESGRNFNQIDKMMP